jgi:hypothetical protein
MERMVARPETSRLPRSLWLAERKGVCRKSEPQVIVWERRSVDRNAAPFHFLLEWASPLSAQFTKLGRRAEFRSPLQAWIQARWGICNSEFGHSPQLQNTASAGFQPDTNLNTIRSLVPGKTVSVALSSSAIFAAN